MDSLHLEIKAYQVGASSKVRNSELLRPIVPNLLSTY